MSHARGRLPSCWKGLRLLALPLLLLILLCTLLPPAQASLRGLAQATKHNASSGHNHHHEQAPAAPPTSSPPSPTQESSSQHGPAKQQASSSSGGDCSGQSGKPQPQPVADIAFGLITSAATMQKRLHHLASWWLEELQGVALLDRDLDSELRLEKPLFAHFRVKVSSKPDFPSGNPDWNNNGERGGWTQVIDVYREFPNVHWYVLGDDDTLFLPPNLHSLLAPRDPFSDLYLGQVSEVQHQVDMFGRMAYGGGGIVLSQHTMTRLQEQFPEFVQRAENRYLFGGDERIGKCLIGEMGVELTTHQGFHQLDIFENVIQTRGWDAPYLKWLETAASPGIHTMSLHHMESLQKYLPDDFSPDAMTHAAKNSPATFLQTTAFISPDHGAFAICHGFSIRWWRAADLGDMKVSDLLDPSKHDSFRYPHARYLQAGSQRIYSQGAGSGTSDGANEAHQHVRRLQLASRYHAWVPEGRKAGGICWDGEVLEGYGKRNSAVHAVQVHHPLPLEAAQLCFEDVRMSCRDDRAYLDIWLRECDGTAAAGTEVAQV